MQHSRQHPWRLARALAAALLLATTWSTASIAATLHPIDDGEVLERLPNRAMGDGATLGALHGALRADPNNLSLAVRTAHAYATLGRAESDPRYYGYAQAALAPWWDEAEPPVAVLVLRAVLHQAGHDFDAALDDLARALARNPSHVQARLTQALVLRAQGRVAEAAESCRELSGRTRPLIVATCLAAAESLSGTADRSYRALRRAEEGAADPSDEIRLWSLTVLGEIAAQTGRAAVAERHFRAALALDRRSTYLLGALADLLLDQGRFSEVRALLDGEIRVDALLLRLTEAEQALDDSRFEAHRADLAARFQADRRRGDSRHLREDSRFHLRILKRPERALELAQENWKTQREPADARLLLEAALAATAPQAAAPVLNWMSETGFDSSKLVELITALKREES